MANQDGVLLEEVCFNVKIGVNRVRVVRLEKGEEVPKAEDLKQIFPL
jgi:hypothetical protein